MKPKSIKAVLEELLFKVHDGDYDNDDGSLCIHCIDSALKELSIIVLAQRKPTCEAYQGDRKHLLMLECVQGEINDNISYNKAIDHISQMILKKE